MISQLRTPRPLAAGTLLAAATLISLPVGAAEWAPSAAATVIGSDNLAQTGSRDSGGSLAVEAGARIAKLSGHLTGEADLGVVHREYSNSDFSGENLFRLSSDFRYAAVSDRFFWTLADDFGQLSAFSFDPVAPTFREDTNVLRTGPTIRFPLGPKMDAEIDAHFSDVYYEVSDIDNQEVGAGLELRRGIGSLRSVYAHADVSQTSFARSDLYSDVDRKAVYLGYSSQLRRLSLTAEAGFNSASVGQSSASGALIRLTGYRYLDAGTLIGLDLSRDLTSSAEAFRRSDAFPVVALSDADIVPVAEPFREERANLRIQRALTKSEFSTGVFAVRESYVRSTNNDREYWGLGLRWAVKISPIWTVETFGSYQRYTKALLDRPKDTRFGVGSTLRVSRDLTAEVRVERLNRTVEGTGLVGFSENRALLSIRYAPEFSGAQRGLFPRESVPLPLQQGGPPLD